MSLCFFFSFPFSFKIKYNFYISVEVVGPFTLSEIIYMIENLLSSYLSYLSFFSFLPVLLRSVFKLFYSRSGGVIITESTVQLLSCGVPTERPGMMTSGSPTWLVAVWLSPHSLHISPTCGSSRHYSDYNSPGIAFLLALQSFLLWLLSEDSRKSFLGFLEYIYSALQHPTTLTALSANFLIFISWNRWGHWALLGLSPHRLSPQSKSCFQAEIQGDYGARLKYFSPFSD